jgi:hypothetical protein
MKNSIRVLPLLLLAGMAACQGDRETSTTTAQADNPSAAPAAAPTATEAQTADRQLATSFDLPAGAIVSIRLQPTSSSPGRVAFSKLALVTGEERTDIDLCADKRLQLVRSRKLGAAGDGSCVIEFGTGSASGWIAPHGLRNLPAIEQPRRLEVAASGDLVKAFQVYLDVGNGYGSRDKLQAESTAAAPATTAAGG